MSTLSSKSDGNEPKATTGADNLAFESEEGETGIKPNSKSSQDEKKDVRISKTPLDNNSPKGDNPTREKEVSLPDDKVASTGIKLYKRRFWMLALFWLCTMLNAMQWMQYTVVSDVTMCFYGVSMHAVNWTANLYLVLYIILVLPASWFMHKMGIRISLLVGSLFTCIGTALQCLSVTPDSFLYVLVSQACASAGGVFIMGLTPYLSATWFGAEELSRASAIGVFGNQMKREKWCYFLKVESKLGSALGFIFTALVVSKDCKNKTLITHGKQIVADTLVTCNVVVFILILTTFQAKPKKPPSIAAAKKLDVEKDYLQSLCALMKNINYDLLLAAYGILVGVHIAVCTILNSLVTPHFPGEDAAVGWMGLIVILSGIVGSVIAGYVLDSTHRYKEMSVVAFFLSILAMILFSALLYVSLLWLQFLTIAILGFFLTSYLPVGLEFAVEITYPISEIIGGQLLNTSTMVVGLIFTEISSYLVLQFNDKAANAFFCVMLVLGTVITALVKCDFRRQRLKLQAEARPDKV